MDTLENSVSFRWNNYKMFSINLNYRFPVNKKNTLFDDNPSMIVPILMKNFRQFFNQLSSENRHGMRLLFTKVYILGFYVIHNFTSVTTLGYRYGTLDKQVFVFSGFISLLLSWIKSYWMDLQVGLISQAAYENDVRLYFRLRGQDHAEPLRGNVIPEYSQSLLYTKYKPTSTHS